MAAFSASRLVCSEMLRMVSTTEPMRSTPCSTALTTSEERWMLPDRVSMVLTVSATQRLPSWASWLASAVAWEACSA
ncbi:hypothetical protein D3C85_1741080 [compost metagenome]